MRLRCLQNATCSATYTYDALGKRTSMTIGGAVTGYTYDVGNRITVILVKPRIGMPKITDKLIEAVRINTLRCTFGFFFIGLITDVVFHVNALFYLGIFLVTAGNFVILPFILKKMIDTKVASEQKGQ